MLSGASEETYQVTVLRVLRWMEEGLRPALALSSLDVLWGGIQSAFAI